MKSFRFKDIDTQLANTGQLLYLRVSFTKIPKSLLIEHKNGSLMISMNYYLIPTLTVNNSNKKAMSHFSFTTNRQCSDHTFHWYFSLHFYSVRVCRCSFTHPPSVWIVIIQFNWHHTRLMEFDVFR